MNNRIYERFLAVVNLAQNPGTEGEGEAAWEMATKMAAKYGFKLPEREVPKQNEEATDWAKKEIWRSFTAKNGYVVSHLFYLLDESIYKVVKNGRKIHHYELYGTELDLKSFINAYKAYLVLEKNSYKLYQKVTGTTKNFRESFKVYFNIGYRGGNTISDNVFKDYTVKAGKAINILLK